MRFRSVLVLILILAAQPVSAQDAYKFEPAAAVLTGKLVEKVFYGPPGYGEDPDSDSREHEAILVLLKPIKVVAAEKDEFNETRDNVKEVQIINTKDIDLSPYFKKKVRVVGKLSSAVTGHHHTDVLIEIDEIHLQK